MKIENTAVSLIAPGPSGIGADIEKLNHQQEKVKKPSLVVFSEPTDPENPKDWTTCKKWVVTLVLSMAGFNRIMVSTIMAPALPTIANELHMSQVEAVMSMSVYLLATAFGPLLIGPLSEMYGRAPILHATNIWFLIWNIVCGFSYHKGILLTARLFAGLGASAIYALGGGVLGDVWHPEQRGRSLGLYLLIPLLSVAIGPIIGGYITQYTTWRWMFWSTSCFQFLMIFFAFACFRETHAPTILHKRAKLLRSSTGDMSFYTTTEHLDKSRSALGVIRNSMFRPIRLLLRHPIIQINALLSAFEYGTLYLVFTSFSELWTTQYHESVSSSGLHYIAVCLGELLGAQITGPLMDLTYKRLKERANGVEQPEYHLPMMIPGAIFVPIGLLLYGWAAEMHMTWIVIDIGIAVLFFGMQMLCQALQGYVIDSYPDHTSSATAATQFLRSLTAFGFPLFAPRMYASLGYGRGNSILAFVAVTVGIPAPFLLWTYGSKLRAKAASSH